MKEITEATFNMIIIINNYIFITRTHLPKDTRGAQLYNSISY